MFIGEMSLGSGKTYLLFRVYKEQLRSYFFSLHLSLVSTLTMASNFVREKLLQVLKGSNHMHFEQNMQWLCELKQWIFQQCPTLQMYIVKGKTVGWLVIMPSEEKLDELGVLDIRILVNLDKTFQLQVFKTCAQEGIITNYHEELIMSLLISFQHGSDYIICQGIEDRSKCLFPSLFLYC